MATAFDHFLAVVAAAGCEPRDVVRVTCYCVERGYGALFDGIREARLGAAAPVSAYFEVAGLSHPAALVCIEGEAVQENAPQR
ncbi:MAG: RidA family protein [Rhodoblastus sp.]|nr:MAG: RidA family protein [Rhodoblastus sp.]